MCWFLSLVTKRFLIDMLPLRSWPLNGISPSSESSEVQRAIHIADEQTKAQEGEGTWSRSSGSLVGEMRSECDPVSGVLATFSHSVP